MSALGQVPVADPTLTPSSTPSSSPTDAPPDSVLGQPASPATGGDPASQPDGGTPIAPVEGSDDAAKAAAAAAAAAAAKAGDGADAAQFAWRKAESVADLLEHELVAPTLNERVDAAKAEAHEAALDDATGEMRPFLQAQEESNKRVSTAVGRIRAGVEKAIADGGLDSDALQELVAAHPDALGLFSDVQSRTGQFQGIEELAVGIAKELDDTALGNTFAARVDKMRAGSKDPTFMPDFVKAIGKAAAKPLQDEIKELKAEVTQLKTTASDKERATGAPPAGPAGRAGNAHITKSMLDAMTQKEVNALTDEQVAQALASK